MPTQKKYKAVFEYMWGHCTPPSTIPSRPISGFTTISSRPNAVPSLRRNQSTRGTRGRRNIQMNGGISNFLTSIYNFF